MLGENERYYGRVWFFHDITERKQAEEELTRLNRNLDALVQERTRALEEEIAQRKTAEETVRASLEEKIVLLREVHHRVKNNLQILISLMNLQSRTVSDPQVIAALQESTQRIRAMSMVHEKLYGGTDLSHIELRNYLSSLVNSQVAFNQLRPGKVTVEIGAQDILLDINTAIPLGLIINELISNAIKYAFPDDREGTIWIDARTNGMLLDITVSDNGIGMPGGIDLKMSPSLGLRLVSGLVIQTEGDNRAGSDERDNLPPFDPIDGKQYRRRETSAINKKYPPAIQKNFPKSSASRLLAGVPPCPKIPIDLSPDNHCTVHTIRHQCCCHEIKRETGLLLYRKYLRI